MARKRDRIFTLVMAFTFLITIVGFSGAVIWQVHENNQSTTDNQATNTNASSQTSCNIDTPVTVGASPAPAAYKPSGTVTSLQVTDLTVGTGQTAKAGDCLVMKYQGNLASTGTVFQQDYTSTEGLQFTLGEGEVIEGWDEGVAGMKVGGERRLVIPPSLGYGSEAQQGIPANSTLVFTVTLEKIKSS